MCRVWKKIKERVYTTVIYDKCKGKSALTAERWEN
ncbi:MAG: hypothetical protein MRERC_3c106 [Mycoplasmataceae bacterium RC_NB112A]|nr:MAG: hypothetical protein MRERC_12c049 [Mycoplasmataceae bacterium RC_NB112A]KLL02255.1 MAG: hypothetical protein MRERC_3c106 [Mycoplasmataceae bacterium RC_NB112A]